ncbi:MAG: FIST C-terminal domain-containing protein [Rhodocyclaceae bacterium]|nr:FIST C-terminal domain-containing protein [Rhodocyclaceae bacterium]
MENVFSACAQGSDTTETVRTMLSSLPKEAADARLVFIFYDDSHDPHVIYAALRKHFPRARLIGGTSARGVFSEKGMAGDHSVGVLVLCDKYGEYGVAAADQGGDPESVAARLLQEALADAGAEGQLPTLVWVFLPSGTEEYALRGLRRIVGDRCPILGGTVAGNRFLSGPKFSQISTAGVFEDAIVVCAMLPSSPVGFALQTGYVPLGPSGVVTAVANEDGERLDAPGDIGRELLEIDGFPAYETYCAWLGMDDDAPIGIDDERALLQNGVLRPLASIPVESDLHQHLPIVPFGLTKNGGIRVRRAAKVGERVYAMEGDPVQLAPRAGRTAYEAWMNLYPDCDSMVGALVVHCAAARIALAEHVKDMPYYIASALDGRPFLGCFSFGEQGEVGGCNVHGNLMISALVFSSTHGRGQP